MDMKELDALLGLTINDSEVENTEVENTEVKDSNSEDDFLDSLLEAEPVPSEPEENIEDFMDSMAYQKPDITEILYSEQEIEDKPETPEVIKPEEVTKPKEPETPKSSAQQNIETFTKRLLNLEHQKKILQEDIKALKQEFKDEGVPIQVVSRVINQIKREKKQTEDQLHEEDIIKEWLLNNKEIDDDIGSLVASS